jgi:hypothetical protein
MDIHRLLAALTGRSACSPSWRRQRPQVKAGGAIGHRLGGAVAQLAQPVQEPAQQAYHWAALFPDQVERAVILCGSARTAVHNQVFLRSLLATLEAAPEHVGNGRFSAQPRAALRAAPSTW